MNSLFRPLKATRPHHPLRSQLSREHDQIREELACLKQLAFADETRDAIEIDFRNQLQFITRSIETHLTSEERVVLQYLYTTDDQPLHRTCVEHVCDINLEIDRVLDELDRLPWKKIEVIRSRVLQLEHLIELHVRYEEKKLFNQLSRIPVESQQSMTRKLVLSEKEFMERLMAMELTQHAMMFN